MSVFCQELSKHQKDFLGTVVSPVSLRALLTFLTSRSQDGTRAWNGPSADWGWGRRGGVVNHRGRSGTGVEAAGVRASGGPKSPRTAPSTLVPSSHMWLRKRKLIKIKSNHGFLNRTSHISKGSVATCGQWLSNWTAWVQDVSALQEALPGSVVLDLLGLRFFCFPLGHHHLQDALPELPTPQHLPVTCLCLFPESRPPHPPPYINTSSPTANSTGPVEPWWTGHAF